MRLFGEDYVGNRELLGTFATEAEAAAFCAPQQWSEVYCAVLVRDDGVEVCYDEDGTWVVI